LLLPHSTDRDLTAAVIQGWTMAEIDSGTLDVVLVSLLELDVHDYADELSRLLERYSAADSDQMVRLPAARRLAEQIWKQAKFDDSYEDPTNGWVLEAINHWAGRIAQFWVRAALADRNLAGEAWSGLPTDLCARLDELLSSHGEPLAMAQVVLARQAHVLTVVDLKWFKATVLPLLDWASTEQASRTWSGYLAGGRWSEELLDAGLAEQYIGAITHAELFDTETRSLLWDHVASIAVTGLRDPTPWIKQVVVSRPLDDRVTLANMITWTLDRLSPEAADGLWNRWMRAYWDDRLNTVPLPLERSEASAMAAWPTRLTGSLHDAVNCAVKAPAGLDDHGGLLGHLDDADVTDRAPGDIARLLAHVLKYTSPPFWGGYYLEKLVPRLAASASPTDLDEIREQAIRLGCINAPDW
jgi:Domain of unknown function (DUF4020)